MMISERLWVGEGPSSPRIRDIVHCATAEQAADAIQKDGCIAVVPTRETAHDTILAMGYSEYHARRATRRWEDPWFYRECGACGRTANTWSNADPLLDLCPFCGHTYHIDPGEPDPT